MVRTIGRLEKHGVGRSFCECSDDGGGGGSDGFGESSHSSTRDKDQGRNGVVVQESEYKVDCSRREHEDARLRECEDLRVMLSQLGTMREWLTVHDVHVSEVPQNIRDVVQAHRRLQMTDIEKALEVMLARMADAMKICVK